MASFTSAGGEAMSQVLLWRQSACLWSPPGQCCSAMTSPWAATQVRGGSMQVPSCRLPTHVHCSNSFISSERLPLYILCSGRGGAVPSPRCLRYRCESRCHWVSGRSVAQVRQHPWVHSRASLHCQRVEEGQAYTQAQGPEYLGCSLGACR